MDKHSTETTQQENGGFVPPRHWVGPEELDAGYWADQTVREKRGQEFFEKPIEAISNIDKTDKAGLARRDFLTIMGASMAMTTFACARRPVHKIIPYVVKPEEIIPGVANYYASTAADCGHPGCGILVKTREGRPIKIEGNPDHPMSRGKLCARGQASVLNLYDPDRLANPLKRERSGSASQADWSQADSEICAKLKQIAAGGGRVRVLTGAVYGESSQRVIREFLSAFRAGEHVEFEPASVDELPEAQALSYGTALVPRYRFDQAEVILSLGADFLGEWLSPVEYGNDWSKNRKLDSKDAAKAKLSKMYCFESTVTVTGGSADERFPVRPGDELKVALAIAHELIVSKRRSPMAGDGTVSAALAGYKPETVAQDIGVEAGKIREIADALWDARGKSLVVAGGIHSRTQDALALQVAVNLLNSALGNDGTTVDGTASYAAAHGSFAQFKKLLDEMNAGRVDALIIYRSNPMYALPYTALGLAGALKKVPLVIAIADRDDETAAYADWVLPDHHYLENWGDSNPRKGLYSLQQPTIAPIHSTRAFQDTLIAWGKATGARGLVATAKDWHDYLQACWKETVYRQYGITSTFEQFWDSTLRLGVFDGYAAQGGGPRPAARAFRASSVSQLPKYAPASGDVVLALYEKPSMGDGRHANNAWLQELPEPLSAVTWDNQLNVGPALAQKLGLAQDDVVEVSTGDVTAQLPVYVQPGMHPSVVSMAIGYGRRRVGKVGNQAGVDASPFVRVAGNRLAYSGQAVKLRKTGRIYRLATTQWHTVTENRPVVNDITLAEFRKNPGASKETHPELRMETVPSMWPSWKYKGYRWGMAIDLNSCTGCSACVVACQAENNVPVVGREQVRNARQMQWLRIDRYYAGTPDKPEVVFQPMLCQHCENAPCETVCPVLATVHDDEGLNVQVYNRCVGTRYCQNNCPYKVRRFNFFDHWKSYEGTLNLAWNPDVTVRTRGIMEKCTFCVQRIREAKDLAKDKGEKVRDGDFKTACQQTCPTDAIVFGDINDPESRVSRLREDARAYRVLETLNTKPSISYLTRVRNREGGENNA